MKVPKCFAILGCEVYPCLEFPSLYGFDTCVLVCDEGRYVVIFFYFRILCEDYVYGRCDDIGSHVNFYLPHACCVVSVSTDNIFFLLVYFYSVTFQDDMTSMIK